MFDIHSHILPGIDDGAKSVNHSVAIAEDMLSQGIQGVIATPHMYPGRYENDIDSIQSSFHEYVTHVADHEVNGLPIKFAAEVHLCSEIMLWLEKDQLPYLAVDGEKKFLLLEFPTSQLPVAAINLCKWLIGNNVIPVIAHPERYKYWQRNSSGLKRFIDMGCLTQVTAGSLVGQFRDSAAELAIKLISENKVHYVASDTHNMTNRSCQMQQAHYFVSQRFCEETSERLFKRNPEQVFELCPSGLHDVLRPDNNMTLMKHYQRR